MKLAERIDLNADDDETSRFLELLDPCASSFTFQTFDDDKSRKNPKLALVIQSPPPVSDELRLRKLNEQGAGIYVTINETDGKGRKTKNIRRIRAVWQDDDDGFDGQFPLEPSIVVGTSPRHFQRIWLVGGDWPADEQGCADFAAVMERMVESYGSDKNAKGIARVLRLPGFLHRKTEPPHMVRIVEASGRRHSRAEIIAAFPPVERAKKAQSERPWTPQGDDERRIRSALYSINADDRELWLQCGMALKQELQEAGRSLWGEWSRRSDKYNERDQDATWKSLRRNDIGIGTPFFHAQQAGWRSEKVHQGPSNGAERDEADSNHSSNARGNGLDGSAKEPPHSREQTTNDGTGPSFGDQEGAWPVLDEAAYYGLAGEVVKALDPHTEADPAGILIQSLTMFGNIVGNGPYIK